MRLSVFDLLEREVSVLVEERREAGLQETLFDASGLASGQYVYRIRVHHLDVPGLDPTSGEDSQGGTAPGLGSGSGAGVRQDAGREAGSFIQAKKCMVLR